MESWVWALIGFVAGIIVYAIINLIIAKDPGEELEKLADERAAELAKAEMKTAVLQDKLLEAETARDQQRDKTEAEYQQKLARANADYQEKLAQAEADYQQALTEAADGYEHKLAAAEVTHREKLALVEQQFTSLEKVFQQQAAEVAATLAAAGLVREATADADDISAREDDDFTGAPAPADEEETAEVSVVEDAAAAIALSAVDGEESLLEPVAAETDEKEQAGIVFETEDEAVEEDAAAAGPAAELLAEEVIDSTADDETADSPAHVAAAAAGGAVVAAALTEDDDQVLEDDHAEEADLDEEVIPASELSSGADEVGAEAIALEGEPSAESEVDTEDKAASIDEDQIGPDTDEPAGLRTESDSEDESFEASAVTAAGIGASAALAATGDEQEEFTGQPEAEIDDLLAEIADLEEADELAELERLEQTDVMADLDELDSLDGAPADFDMPAEALIDEPEITDLAAGEVVRAGEAEFDEAGFDATELDEPQVEESDINEVEIEEPEFDDAALGHANDAVAAAAMAAELDPAPDLAQEELTAEPEISQAVDAEEALVESAWPEDTSVWTGEYFNNMKLEGEPVFVREDAEIDFDWGMGSPAPEINEDGFSVRWTRTADLAPGLYRFTVTSDDGARLWVNDRLVISAWYDHTEMTFRREMELPGGLVDLRLEYYENAMEALVRVSWERIG